MEEHFRMPPWGPAVDPSPDDPSGYDPQWWWRRRIPFPPWDPVDLREKLKDIIKLEDVVALEHAKLASMRVELEAEMKFANARMKAQMDLMAQQMEILQKYRG